MSALRFFGTPCRLDEDLAEGWFRVRFGSGITELRIWGSQPIPPGAASIDVAPEDWAGLQSKLVPDEVAA